MSVDIFVFEQVAGQFGLDEGALGRYAEALLTAKGIGARDVNLVFMDDAAIADLNTRYRGREGATDVLSFILSDAGADPFVGEVYVSLERAADQAREFDVTIADETLRLVTHGLLHLAGRVHDTDTDYEAMMRETDEFMRTYGAENGCS
jgi:probable rRNA maturation factor